MYLEVKDLKKSYGEGGGYVDVYKRQTFISEMEKADRSIITFIIRYMTIIKISADIATSITTIGPIISVKICELSSTFSLDTVAYNLPLSISSA